MFYAAVPGFNYAIPNGRHLFSIEVPFFHNIFPEELGGFENTTGIGDIRMRYMGIAIHKKDPLGFSKLAFFGELTAPTGEYLLGRGAGTWLFKPGVITGWNLTPEVAIYPELQFQFSTSETALLGGGLPVSNPDNFDLDKRLQEFVVQFPAVMAIDAANAWFRINPKYIHSVTEGVSYLFFEAQVGKMLGDYSSASVNLSRFIAGQPRLSVIVQFQFSFYLK